MKLIVTLPLPSKALSPNGRAHWAKKARAVSDYRWWAKMACLSALREVGETSAWDAAIIEPHFYFRVAQRRDSDNLAACLKSACDGLADAGLVANDYTLRNAEPVVHIGAARPRVELWITKLEAAE